ncbi:MAG: Uncharacterised protein [Euryarchaeota archaeon UBA443]|nr:MAG: Uncharacterised protein [Euryarchaeota archaeon UBA443]
MYENPRQCASTSPKLIPDSVASAVYVADAEPASIESTASAVTAAGMVKVRDSPADNRPTLQVIVSP